MSEEQFIKDAAANFGLDVDVKHKEDEEIAKDIYKVSQWVDGQKYMFELVVDVGTRIHEEELALQDLKASLHNMQEAINKEN